MARKWPFWDYVCRKCPILGLTEARKWPKFGVFGIGPLIGIHTGPPLGLLLVDLHLRQTPQEPPMEINGNLYTSSSVSATRPLAAIIDARSPSIPRFAYGAERAADDPDSAIVIMGNAAGNRPKYRCQSLLSYFKRRQVQEGTPLHLLCTDLINGTQHPRREVHPRCRCYVRHRARPGSRAARSAPLSDRDYHWTP
jgi:hypothetical protein